MRQRRAKPYRAWLPAAGMLAAMLAASPGQARDCRRENVPPGVRMPQQVGCKPTPPDRVGGKGRPSAKADRKPGFIDLGNGTELRISGDAGVDMRSRR
jgi:hypothetical protein